jgi:YD repeat-containing protein
VLSKLLDANGDGLSDVVQYDNGAIRLYLRESKMPDLLVRIHGGTRPANEISYLPASDPTVHVASPYGPSCAYPQQCVRGGRWLVREVRTDDGVGGQRVIQHRFNGIRTSYLYGDLGPSSHRIFDPQTGNQWSFEMDNVTASPKPHIRQRYPFANLVNSETFISQQMATGKRIVIERKRAFIDVAGLRARMMRPSEDCLRRYETTRTGGSVGSSDKISESCSTFGYDVFGNVHTSSRTNGRGERVTELFGIENWSNPRVLGVLKKRTSIGFSPADGTRGASQQLTVTDVVPDARGQVSQMIIEPQASGVNVSQKLVRTFIRNGRGQIVETIDVGRSTALRPDGVVVEQADQTRRSTVAYDTVDGVFPLRSRNAKGHTTQYLFHPGLGVLLATEDPNGVLTHSRFDGFGRYRGGRRSGDGDLNVSYGLGDVGALGIGFTQSGGPSGRIVLDSFGRTIIQDTTAFNGRTVRRNTVYDSLGQISRVSEPFFIGESVPYNRYLYDAIGRPIFSTDPKGKVQSVAYDRLRSTLTDPENNESYSQSDENGRPTETGRGGQVTRFFYGPFGRLERVIQPGNHTVAMEFDQRGRRTKLIDPDSGTSLFAHNSFSEVVHRLDANGHVESTIFDEEGRTTAIANTDGITALTYDLSPFGIGTLAETRSPSGIVSTHTYDEFSRPVSESISVGGQSPMVIDQGYDIYGRPSDVTYPDVPGQPPLRLKYRYNATVGGGGELIDILNTNNGVRVWQAEDMNSFGQVTQELFGNGVRARRSHEAETGLLKSIESAVVGEPPLLTGYQQTQPPVIAPAGSLGTGSRLQDLQFDYDGNRNLKNRIDSSTTG